MENLSTGYQQLGDEDAPRVFCHTAGTVTTQWQHLRDLDRFFINAYNFHQEQGILCILADKLGRMARFAFVCLVGLYMTHCVRYDVITNLEPTVHAHFSDVVYPIGECVASLSIMLQIIFGSAVLYLVWCAACAFWEMRQYYETKLFYNNALGFTDNMLHDLHWSAVQKKIVEVQREQRMCINQDELSELDIYHRILRHTNYLVALVQQDLLPFHYKWPLLGTGTFFSRQMQLIIKYLFFEGPVAFFENNWNLKQEYKQKSDTNRKELAERLRTIIWLTFALCFIMSPVIFLYQIFTILFSKFEILRFHKDSVGKRRWSEYGRVALRHFNELDHELNARLKRAHRPANKYMNSFFSKPGSVLSKYLREMLALILTVMIIFAFMNVISISVLHIGAGIATVSFLIYAFSAFIPEEDLVCNPEMLLRRVRAHVSYLPDSWIGQAHTSAVASEFSRYFQYEIIFLLEELFSPLLTLYFLGQLTKKSYELIDFFRNFTVEVAGIGDVCSFAQLNVIKHGSPQWAHLREARKDPNSVKENFSNQYTPAQNNKTELSLIHFSLTNPNWQPPEGSNTFMANIQSKARTELSAVHEGHSGLNDLFISTAKTHCTSISNLWPQRTVPTDGYDAITERDILRGERISHLDGTYRFSDRGILAGAQKCQLNLSMLSDSSLGIGALLTEEFDKYEATAADICVMSMYLQHLKDRPADSEVHLDVLPHAEPHVGRWVAQQNLAQDEHSGERIPLLDQNARLSS